MAHFYLKDGVRYYPGRKFSYQDINYTRAGATDAVFEALGFTRVEVQAQRPDDRYYYVTGPDDTGAYTSTPRDLDELKASAIEQVKQDARQRLTGTDWLVIRGSEDPGKPVSSTIKAYRQGIRLLSSTREAEIAACSTVEELAQLGPIGWPEDPTAQPA